LWVERRHAAPPQPTPKPHTIPTPALMALTSVCPAHCYELNDRGQVEVTADGCLECGTCRIICQDTQDVEWSYQRGGFGVLFKFR
jgi:ferredoxin like protein